MLAANRANARKSRGPVTALGKMLSRGNAAKHWGRAETIRDLMSALGEDPAEFERLREDLYRALAPREDFEMLLVDDMADIHWRLRRMIRAEAAAQATHRREQQALREAEDANREAGRLNELEPYIISTLGLAGLQDSPPKFARILQILRALELFIQGEGFAGEGIVYLKTVYGPNNPGLRGRHLINEYHQLSEEQKSADAAAREAARETHRAFLDELKAEIAWFDERAARDRQARIDLEVPRTEAELLKAEYDPAKLVYYHETLERRFERKWKLLRRHRSDRQMIVDVTADADATPGVDADEGEAAGRAKRTVVVAERKRGRKSDERTR